MLYVAGAIICQNDLKCLQCNLRFDGWRSILFKYHKYNISNTDYITYLHVKLDENITCNLAPDQVNKCVRFYIFNVHHFADRNHASHMMKMPKD